MKKVLYSIMMVAIALTGCTTWDDPKTENYGDGPSVNITVTETADSTFTFTITPGAGTLYYSYVVDEADEADALDGATLLKGGYSSVSQEILNTNSAATFTYNMRKADNTPLCEPNTTYQIYAVAANDKGIVGEVVAVSVTTTDAKAPKPASLSTDAAAKSATITFDQALVRGEGKVTGAYYKEFDFSNPVALTEDDITVEISGNTATFTAADVPAGAHMIFSWEAGAFTDETGNKCGAFTTVVDETAESVEDMFVGVYVHVTNVNWAIADENVTPATDAVIGDWEGFKGVMTMPFNVYLIEDDIKAGDIAVTYTNDDKTVTYNLKADQWSVEGKKISFKLPVEPTVGDMVTFKVAEGVIYDVYGNVNDAYSSEKIIWKYAGFIPTKDMILGTFNFIYQSAYDETPTDYDGGTITIAEDPENTELENALVIKDLYLEGSEIPGYYDLDKGIIYVAAWQILGTTMSRSGELGLISINRNDTSADWIPFTINKDGSLTSDSFGVYAYDAAFENPMGWWERATIATFTPAKAAAARKGAAKASATVKKTVNKVRLSNKRIRK